MMGEPPNARVVTALPTLRLTAKPAALRAARENIIVVVVVVRSDCVFIFVGTDGRDFFFAIEVIIFIKMSMLCVSSIAFL
jgi:hypothetical protein